MTAMPERKILEGITGMFQTRLWAYIKYASGFQCPPHIVYIADKVQETINRKTSKHKLLLIHAPPRHGKSELIPVHAPSFLLGHNPKLRIIIAAYSASLAEKHSARARDLFETNGPLLWNANPSPSVFSRSTWDTDKGGGVKAIGIGGGITGFGANVFFIDDYHSERKESESLLQRNTVWDWWQSAAATRLHPGGTVVIFATRWHEDDLVGRLLAQKVDMGDKFPFEMEHINLPGIAEEDDPLGRKEGEALWRWWMNEEQLKDIEKIVGPYEWASLFQGRPTARGGNLFKSENFRYYTIDPMTSDFLCWRNNIEEPIRIRKNELVRHVYCDPSLEIKTTNDPTGMAAWGYSKKHRIWLLLDRLNGKIDHSRIMTAIKQFAFKNRCTIIGIENEKIGKILVKQSAGNDEVGGVKIPFKEVPTKGLDKYARATPMAAYYENERVFIHRDAPYRVDYENNLTTFPNAKHDEDVDITAMAEYMEGTSTLAEALARRK